MGATWRALGVDAVRPADGGDKGPPRDLVFDIHTTSGYDERMSVRSYRHTVSAGDHFVVFFNPRWAQDRPTGDGVLESWQRGGFASTGIGIDLEFADGAYLSELGAVDQYGHDTTARGQGAARWLRTDQWNRVDIDLARAAGRTVVAAIVELAGAPGQEMHARVILRGFGRVVAGERSGVDLVDTRRGTFSTPSMSRGNTYPSAAFPNASAFVAPMTHRNEPGWIYQYTLDPPSLEAFVITRLPSPWIGDHGSLQLFPATRDPDGNIRRMPLAFRREREVARPHDYSVTFDNGMSVRFVAGMRGTVAHIDFGGNEPVLAMAPTGGAGAIGVDEAEPHQLFAHSDFVSLSVRHAPRTFYRFISDAKVVESWVGAEGEQFFRFDLQEAVTGLTLRVGWSYLSLEQAQRNVLDEFGDDGIKQAEQRARLEWDELLNRVTLEGVTSEQRETFFSCLYRIFLFPNIAFDELDGQPGHPARLSACGDELSSPHGEGRLSIGGGFWDTYRTTWPAYFLFAPRRAVNLLDGFVQHYLDSGWIPRWSGPGPIDCMVGTSSDAVFADAFAKGVPLQRVQEAYAATLKNATVPSGAPEVGRKGQNRSSFVGYTSTDISEGLSWTMESSICDSAIAEWASRLRDGETGGSAAHNRLAAEAEYFANRSLTYRTLFDANRRFFVGRTAQGTFRDDAGFDPAVWGGDYAETNAWGMAHSAPHDGDGLAALYGGRAGLGASLDAFFSTMPPPVEATRGSYPSVIHEMVEARDVRMGMWAPSNQPAHHTPLMYVYSDRPHRAQPIVREAVRRLFVGGDNGQGYPGDEDNGEMSAWYVFLSLGLYPLTLGTGLYIITSPSVGRASLHLENGKTLTVLARNQGPHNHYIQSVSVNGEPWTQPFISHDILARGCTLDIELGPVPTDWGRLPDELSCRAALTDATSRVPTCSSTPEDALTVIDDDSEGECIVAPGWWFAAEIGDVPVTLYTLTSGESAAGPSSWRLQGSNDGSRWTDLDVRKREGFEWGRMTRPFLVSSPAAFRYVRIVIDGGERGSLAQIELFVPQLDPT